MIRLPNSSPSQVSNRRPRVTCESTAQCRSLFAAGLEENEDGSVDLYFGPTTPKGFENNWVQTLPGKHWFSYFRLYAPTEAYFDKTWKMDDISPESVAGSSTSGLI